MAIYVCLCVCLRVCLRVFVKTGEVWLTITWWLKSLKSELTRTAELLLTCGHLRCQGSKHNTGRPYTYSPGVLCKFPHKDWSILHLWSVLYSHGEDKSREVTIRYWEMLHSRRRCARFPTRFHSQALTEYGIQDSLPLIWALARPHNLSSDRISYRFLPWICPRARWSLCHNWARRHCSPGDLGELSSGPHMIAYQATGINPTSAAGSPSRQGLGATCWCSKRTYTPSSITMIYL